MDKSNQKSTSMKNTTEAVLSQLVSGENKSQNSFVVFGDVYVTNEMENSNQESEISKQDKKFIDELKELYLRVGDATDLLMEINRQIDEVFLIEEDKC